MAKTEAPRRERQIAPAMIFLPLTVRDAVDQLAQQEQVSRSEIGRRALVDYLTKRPGRKG